MSDVDTWLDTPIAEIQQNMIVDEPFTARIAPHPFINVLLHALLQTSGAQIASTALFDSATGIRPLQCVILSITIRFQIRLKY